MRLFSRTLLVAAAVATLALGQDAKKSTPKSLTGEVAGKAADLLDINTATKPQLEALKGVGPKYAEAIIKGRPYARKDELTSKKVLPDNVYAMVKDLIIAKQPAKK